MKPALVILALVLPAACAFSQTSAPATRDAAAGPAAKAMAELFAQNDPAGAKDKQQAVLEAVGGDMGKLKAAIAADAAYEKLAPGWVRKAAQVTAPDKKYDMEYFIRVPKGYDPAKRWPLLIVFHGQHSSGDHAGGGMAHILGPAAEDFVMLAPTIPGPEVYNGQAYQEQSCLTPLAYVRTHLNIDDDRMVITGYSLGGHQAWHLAAMYERLWAAAVPMAGVPWFEGSPFTNTLYMENLATLPMWSIWGELDRPADPKAQGNVDLCRAAAARLKVLKNTTFRGTEIPGGGHGDCWPEPADFLKFLAGKKRPNPADFIHCFHVPTDARGYWLEATGFAFKPMDLSKPIAVKTTSKDPKEAQEAGQRLVSGKMYRLIGKCDTAANTIFVRGTGFRTARLYLIDGMLDLSKPVTISFLGRPWKGRIAPSPECVLENYAATRDQTQLIVNEIDLEGGGRITPKYK